MTRRQALPFLLTLVAACSVITDFSPERLLEQTEELCSDGVDNDDNGKVDCADTSCKQFDFCLEDTEARCIDGRDNDADGRTDCQDPDCCSQPTCAGEPTCGERTAVACSDGLDNDNNGLTDCADFSCSLPICCTRLVPLLAETFSAANSACTPIDCSAGSSNCCDQPVAECNHFDSQRWVAWGNPPPRIDAGRFTPNQPCTKCPASGLLSVAGTELSPDLVLDFDVDLAGDPDAMISVGLADKALIPGAGGECGGVVTPFPLLAGVTISGPRLLTEVGGVVRQVYAGDSPINSGTQRLRIAVEQDGSIVFHHNDRMLDTTKVHVQQPYRWVRVVVQGRSTGASVDNVLLARRQGCPDPDQWRAGTTGPGPVFVPGGKPTAFDAAGAESPAALLVDSTLFLYYTGRTTALQGTRIGYTTSTDGLSWITPGAPLTIHGETSKSLADPMVLKRGAGLLMVYRSGVSTSDAAIVAASSTDGVSWNRVKTILTPGAAGTWDSGEVSAPALVEFRHRLYLWYVGTSTDGTSTPAIGLAMAEDNGKLDFQRSKVNPVLRPASSGSSDRGVTDPWVMGDGTVLHMWYVGHTWGGKTTINYAVSEDGRNWVQFPDNPVIAADAPDLFGSTGVGAPTLIDHWGKLDMWYGGVDPGGLPSIGHAVNLGAP